MPKPSRLVLALLAAAAKAAPSSPGAEPPRIAGLARAWSGDRKRLDLARL